ncbi:conserved protein of unknown function [Ectopseudomonas oleovorans]|uniref:Uncharacterized protein n=1 Tax=Ectopseudomonas oleovorans TaxID=301 RepID=A0A653B9G2_ECTOL|nr:conserved protein of unknown function [Pseudomonas oleovorans]
MVSPLRGIDQSLSYCRQNSLEPIR